MLNKAYIILPTITGYTSKDVDTKNFIDNTLKLWLNRLTRANFVINCFAEDELALRLLLENDSISWLSLLERGDSYFVSDYTELDNKDAYISHSSKKISKDILDLTKKKYKIPSGLVPNTEEWLSARFNVMRKRLKKNADTVLADAKYIIYFNDNVQTNWLQAPTHTEQGDGRMIINVNINTMTTKITWGGFNLREEDIDRILGGI